MFECSVECNAENTVDEFAGYFAVFHHEIKYPDDIEALLPLLFEKKA